MLLCSESPGDFYKKENFDSVCWKWSPRLPVKQVPILLVVAHTSGSQPLEKGHFWSNKAIGSDGYTCVS